MGNFGSENFGKTSENVDAKPNNNIIGHQLITKYFGHSFVFVIVELSEVSFWNRGVIQDLIIKQLFLF